VLYTWALKDEHNLLGLYVKQLRGRWKDNENACHRQPKERNKYQGTHDENRVGSESLHQMWGHQGDGTITSGTWNYPIGNFIYTVKILAKVCGSYSQFSIFDNFISYAHYWESCTTLCEFIWINLPL